MVNFEDRASVGAKWLDENYPGWEKKVNLETLNTMNPECCIVGQVICPPSADHDLFYEDMSREKGHEWMRVFSTS